MQRLTLLSCETASALPLPRWHSVLRYLATPVSWPTTMLWLSEPERKSRTGNICTVVGGKCPVTMHGTQLSPALQNSMLPESVRPGSTLSDAISGLMFRYDGKRWSSSH